MISRCLINFNVHAQYLSLLRAKRHIIELVYTTKMLYWMTTLTTEPYLVKRFKSKKLVNHPTLFGRTEASLKYREIKERLLFQL